MEGIQILTHALQQFAGLTEDEVALSLPYWQVRDYKKDAYYNKYKSICTHLGFITDGVFRSYIIDAKSGEEKNVFLYSKHQFVVSFKSFINQAPCDYHTTAMTDASAICIHIDDLMRLYGQSHHWERFGRLLAQEAFNVAIDRAEGFLFRTAEERYLDLIRQYPDISNAIPLYHISSYLGIQGPSLSRIRKRIADR